MSFLVRYTYRAVPALLTKQRGAVRTRTLVESRVPHVSKAVRKVFSDWRGMIARQVVAATDLSGPNKVDLAVLFKAKKSKDPKKIAESVDTDSFASDIADAVSDNMEDVFKLAGADAVEVAGIEDDKDQILDVVNEEAVKYAEEHGAELIDGIDDTTREELQQLIAEGIDEGWSTDQLSKAIEDSYSFSDYRADMIARTEMSFAANRGTQEGWRQSGVVSTKVWLTAPDCCDECDDLDGEEVDLDEDFSSGDDGPPLHPNCRCTLTAGVKEEPKEEDQSDEEDDTEKGTTDLAALLKGEASDHPFRGNQYTSGQSGGGKAQGMKTGLKLTRVSEPAFSGEQKNLKTQLTKLETGALGERIAVTWMQDHLGYTDARSLNEHGNNFAIDLVGDHSVTEVKAGLVSNGKSAQQWRATQGQPGKKETAWLKQASPEAKAAWNKKKTEAIMQRKAAAVKEVSKRVGYKVKPHTVTVIIDPDRKIADIYHFEGFHSRINWNSDQAKNGYVGSFKYK